MTLITAWTVSCRSEGWRSWSRAVRFLDLLESMGLQQHVDVPYTNSYKSGHTHYTILNMLMYELTSLAIYTTRYSTC